MLSRVFIGSYKLEKVLHLCCTGFNYAIYCDFQDNEKARFHIILEGKNNGGMRVMRIHTNLGRDPMQRYRTCKSIKLLLIVMVLQMVGHVWPFFSTHIFSDTSDMLVLFCFADRER